MSDKTPAQKLGLKPGMRAALLHFPEGLELGLPSGIEVVGDIREVDFALEFAMAQAPAVSRLEALAADLPPNAIAWIA